MRIYCYTETFNPITFASAKQGFDYPTYGSVISELQYAHVSEGDTASYMYGFNNQERDGELGEYYAFEYRIHDARIGRFLSVDPLSSEYPWYSSYQFAGNTPICSIDLEGLEPYLITSRAFAPWKMFGGQYSGDSRGFTTSGSNYILDNDPTARIHHTVSINFNNSDAPVQETNYYGIEKGAWSDVSLGPSNFIFGESSKRALPWSNISNPYISTTNYGNWTSNTIGYSSSFGASNPLVNLSPEINFSNKLTLLKYTSSMYGTTMNYLQISGTVTGDKFPAYEVIIQDNKLQSISLFTFAPESKDQISKLFPPTELIGYINVKIVTDSNGNFLGVEGNGITYTIEAWNEMMTNKKPAGDCLDNNCNQEEE